VKQRDQRIESAVSWREASSPVWVENLGAHICAGPRRRAKLLQERAATGKIVAAKKLDTVISRGDRRLSVCALCYVDQNPTPVEQIAGEQNLLERTRVKRFDHESRRE
jgi:hypothetical protein